MLYLFVGSHLLGNTMYPLSSHRKYHLCPDIPPLSFDGPSKHRATSSPLRIRPVHRPSPVSGLSKLPPFPFIVIGACTIPSGSDVTEIVTASGQWLSQSPIPKLFIQAIPGTQDPNQLAFNHTWPAQSKVSVRGHHTPQEDSPDEIGQAIASWLLQLQ